MSENNVEDLLNKAKDDFRNRVFLSALNSIDKIVEIEPENGSVWFLQGQIYFETQKYHEAVKSLNNAFECDPEIEDLEDLRKRVKLKMKKAAAAELRNADAFAIIEIFLFIGAMSLIILMIVGAFSWQFLITAILCVIIGIGFQVLRNKLEILAKFVENI